MLTAPHAVIATSSVASIITYIPKKAREGPPSASFPMAVGPQTSCPFLEKKKKEELREKERGREGEATAAAT